MRNRLLVTFALVALLGSISPLTTVAQGPAPASGSAAPAQERVTDEPIDWANLPNIFYAGQLEKNPVTQGLAQPLPEPVALPAATASITFEEPDILPPEIDLTGSFTASLTTEPPVLETASAPKVSLPVLQGIVLSSDSGKSVIINGQILGEGDFIEGFTISQIRKNSVLLKRQREEHVLYVKP